MEVGLIKEIGGSFLIGGQSIWQLAARGLDSFIQQGLTAFAPTKWKTLCWVLGIQTNSLKFKDYPRKWKHWMTPCTCTFPQELVPNFVTCHYLFFNLRQRRSRWISHDSMFQLPAIIGHPRLQWYCWCPPPVKGFQDITERWASSCFPHPSHKGAPASSHHKLHWSPSPILFLGTWLVLLAMLLVHLLSAIKAKTLWNSMKWQQKARPQWSKWTVM